MATPQQQSRFVTPRFYRQYNEQNRPAVPPKPVPSSPHSRSHSSTFSKSSETSTHGQLQPPSAHQRSVSMNTTPSSVTSRKPAPTRPSLSLILPGSQSLTPPDSRSPSHLRSSSYTIGQNQSHLTPTSQPQRTISETLHTRNTTVPSIITTPVSPTDSDARSPGHTRTRSCSNTSDGPSTTAAGRRARGPSLSSLQTVTQQTPLNSHPRSPRESTVTASSDTSATAEDPPQRDTTDESEQAGDAITPALAPAAVVKTESSLVKPESRSSSESQNRRTTTKQAPPMPSESGKPTPEPKTMGPVGDLLRSKPSQDFNDNRSLSSNTTTTTGVTNQASPYQNASSNPNRKSIAAPAARSSMPEPPTQSHVQIRNSRLSFTNLKSNTSLNSLLQSQSQSQLSSEYQATAPGEPSQSSASTTLTSTAPSPQPQPTQPTPLSSPSPIPQAATSVPPGQPQSPNPNDASSLLALTHHVHTQSAQAQHLYSQLQHYLPFVEKQWIQSTIADTEAAARDILLLTESMRIDQETNNGRVGLKTQLRWMVRDSRRARERRERLVLCHASLVAVLVRLEGVRAKVPDAGLSPAGPGSGPGFGGAVEVAASSSVPLQGAELPNSNVPPPFRPPPVPVAATTNGNPNSYPAPPTTAPPPIPKNSKRASQVWELPVQVQDGDKEPVESYDKPPPVPPKVKLEEDVDRNSTAPVPASVVPKSNVNVNGNPITNGSIISGRDTDMVTPRTMSPVSPEDPTKLDNELLDMLEWRWKQGRVA